MLDTNVGDDEVMIEALVRAASSAMERASIPDITTSSEVVSAAFTLLDRTLRGIRAVQDPSDRFDTASKVADALQELMIDHGSVPN